MSILTGIRPTGIMHYGNFKGAIEPTLKTGPATFLIADYHALNDSRNVAQKTQDLYNLINALCGIYGCMASIIIQSHYPAYEIAGLLSPMVPSQLLIKSHTMETLQASGEIAHAGHMLYPLLMAADIFALQTDEVAIGPDQKQSYRLYQYLAKKLQQKELSFRYTNAKVVMTSPLMGIDGRKMSKSYGNTLPVYIPKEGRTDILHKLLNKIPTSSVALGEAMPLDDKFFQITTACFPLLKSTLTHCYAHGKGYAEAKAIVLEYYLRTMTEIDGFYDPEAHKNASIPKEATYDMSEFIRALRKLSFD